MMNKKGFTLVELLSVVVILGVLIVLIVPFTKGSFYKMKGSIEKVNRDNLIEGAKTLGTDIYICDICHEQYDLSGNVIVSCDGYKDILQEVSILTGESNMDCIKAGNLLKNGIRVSVQYLKDNDYFSDRANNCEEDGEMTIKEQNGNIKVTLDEDVLCNRKGN